MSKDLDGRFLKDFEVGEEFIGFYVVRNRDLRTRRNGMPYLTLEIGDRSGRLKGNIWDDAEMMFEQMAVDTVVKVKGIIETYQGNKQITFKQIRRARDDDDFDTGIFLSVANIDIEGSIEKLRRIAKALSNEYLRDLLLLFLTDENITEGLMRAPGGKLWHHNRLGGLLEHTLGVLRLCRMMGRFYPESDSDLLTAGAILHDIGKIEEFKYDLSFDYTDRGRIVGHIVLGAEWVTERAKQIDDFPHDLLDKLVHLVLSHQGEFGSPVQPSTREAFLLHYADLIDSKMDALKRIEKDLPEGEQWKYVNLLGRQIMFPDNG